MRISNVGLFVKDLEGARKFFEDYFGAQVHATYNEDNGYRSYIMKFDENPKLELMTKPSVVDEKKDPNRTGFVHICIKVDSREKLDDALYAQRLYDIRVIEVCVRIDGDYIRKICDGENCRREQRSHYPVESLHADRPSFLKMLISSFYPMRN